MKECSLFGPLSAGLEVKHPLTETAFLYDMDTGKAFTSVVYTSVDGYSFLFAGTNEGTLHQVRHDGILIHVLVITSYVATHEYY